MGLGFIVEALKVVRDYRAGVNDNNSSSSEEKIQHLKDKLSSGDKVPSGVIYEEKYTLTNTAENFYFPFTAIDCIINNSEYGTTEARIKLNPDNPESDYITLKENRIINLTNVPGGIRGFKGYTTIENQETILYIMMVRK